METEVLKEPRGFLRCIEWFYAIVAFATCANFSTSIGYSITCMNNATNPIQVVHPIHYPFRFNSAETSIIKTNDLHKFCFNETIAKSEPEDFHSGASFFVFTGVLAWLGTTASLVIYVFFPQKYMDHNRELPKIDFFFTFIMVVFWFCSSAIWAGGLNGLKSVIDESWLYSSIMSPCQKIEDNFVETEIEKCTQNEAQKGTFLEANVSIIFGFQNFFLWSSNLWFIYKETEWFAKRSHSSKPFQTLG